MLLTILQDILKYGAQDLFKEEQRNIEDLKKLLQSKDIDFSDCLEQSEFEAKAIQHGLMEAKDIKEYNPIYYDDDAIDKLLDRNQQSNTQESAVDIEWLNPFKVARVWDDSKEVKEEDNKDNQVCLQLN